MSNASTEFARDVFAWQEQIHTDRATIANAKPISGFDFRLAYAVTQYTNKHSRKAWPKQETLAADLGVDLRTVGRGIANLVKRGHLSVTRRGREQSAIYRMILQDKTSVSDHDEVRPDTGVGSKTQDKTSVSSRPDTGVIKTGHQCLIEPLLEPKERGARQARPRGPLSGEGGNPPPTTMTESMITRALQRAGWDTVKARNEFEKFRNRALSKGTASLNWDAEFYNWIERGVEHQARRKGQAGKIIDQEGNDVAPPPQAKPRPRKQSNTERARGLLQ